MMNYNVIIDINEPEIGEGQREGQGEEAISNRERAVI
jgi:hypothetical protein